MLEFRKAVFRQGTFELNIDWSVKRGDHLSIIGPSGAGKSTLLNGLAGFVETVSGQVIWDGTRLADQPDKRPVSSLFQDNNLFPHLSVAQNVGLGIAPSIRLPAAAQARVSTALDEVGLKGFEQRMPGALSGGQQSRTALARVLVQARPIILLDEPFSALGPAMRSDMLDLVRRVARRLDAVLMMVTHDPMDAKNLGGQAVFVAGGDAHAPVKTETLFANPPAALSAYLGGA